MAYKSYVAYWVPSGADAATRDSRHIVVAMNEDKAVLDAMALDAGVLAQAVREYGAGALTVHGSQSDIPPWAVPGNAWFVVAAGTLSRVSIVQFPLRTGYRAFHERLESFYELSRVVGPNYDFGVVVFIRNILHGLHQGAYWQHHHGGLSGPNQLLWLQTSALGPNDAVGGVQVYNRDDPETFVELVEPITPKTVPGALSVCVPTLRNGAFARRTAAQMLAARLGTDANQPTRAQLDRGRWIDRING